MKIKEEEYINKQFDSKYGPYIILRNAGNYGNNNGTLVEIMFIISESHTITELTNALNGRVRDPNYGINLNKLYHSDNYGTYRVIEIYKGKSGMQPKAKIRFTETGCEKMVQAFRAKDGDIHDDYATHKTPIDMYKLDKIDRTNKYNRYMYVLWREMRRRCNDEKVDNYDSYGGMGIKVCEEWNDFNTFCNDLQYLPQYDKWCRFPTLYQLDKDYLQLSIPKNMRIYSPKTCMFLYYIDNMNLARIEYRNNHPELPSKYFGVTQETANTYSAKLIVNNHYIYLGTFDDEIVAANAFNHFYEHYHNYDIIPLRNNVPYVSPEEFIKHNTNPKLVVKVVERKKDL